MTGNRILDVLPSAAQRPLQKLLLSLPAGAELVTPDERMTHAFFPTTALCSVIIELDSGDKAESATVGPDGFVGVPLVLGATICDARGVVEVAGDAYRIAAKALFDLCRDNEPFRRALFGYGAFRLHLASRTLACNSFHSILQRMARWLLFLHDRLDRNDFRVTHERLSSMLAATRPRISQAAARLKGEGIIDYRRGLIRILDRARLETMACECYGRTRRLYPVP
jgi:CRP-like cAMP-binding protein